MENIKFIKIKLANMQIMQYNMYMKGEKMNVEFRKPTTNEINFIVEKANSKKEKLNISIVELSKKLEVNYCNLTRVLSGGLVNYQIINKLNEWINE